MPWSVVTPLFWLVLLECGKVGLHLLPDDAPVGGKTLANAGDKRDTCVIITRDTWPEDGTGAVEVYLQHGEKLSELLKKQRTQPGGCETGGPLRFTNSIILWIQCSFDVLVPRLNDRVDGMLAQGLLDELLDFHREYNKENSLRNKSPDYTKGIFQSIGFKEFHEYLIMDEEQRKTEAGKKLFENGIELLKIATRQYAKYQCKWIQNRFLRNAQRQVPPIYALDGNDVSQWNDKVYKVAEDIIESHLAGNKPSHDPLPLEDSKVIIDKCYKCEICQKTLVGKTQWEIHLNSLKHRKMVKRKIRQTHVDLEHVPSGPEFPANIFD